MLVYIQMKIFKANMKNFNNAIFANSLEEAKDRIRSKAVSKVFVNSGTAANSFHYDEGYWHIALDGQVLFASNLICSFSGGRTSAYMSYLLKNKYPETIFVFANTGLEHSKTLEFVDAVDRTFDLNLIWLEADFASKDSADSSVSRLSQLLGLMKDRPLESNESRLIQLLAATKRNPLGFKRVTFESASRSGEPFEIVIRRFGLPNQSFPHCSRELKKNVINRYFKEVGLSDRFMAIGLRADEIDRYSATADADRLWYPLMEKGIVKDDVLKFWDSQTFDLEVSTIEGNCQGCWKKSENKLRALAHTSPEVFLLMQQYQDKYSDHFPETQSNRRNSENYMYRGYKEPSWFVENKLASDKFDEMTNWVESSAFVQQDLDLCGSESCEAF